MVNNVFKRLMLVCISAGIFLFTACQDKDYYDPDFAPVGEVGDEPSTLEFSTTQNIKLNLNYDTPKGFVSVFDVYSVNPLDANGVLRSDVSPIAGGINVAGVSQLSRVLPSYVKELYVYSPNLFVPLLSYAKIVDGEASFNEVLVSDAGVSRSSVTRAGNAGNLPSRPVIEYLKGKEDFYTANENGHFKYDLINPDLRREIPVEVLTSIGQNFPERKFPDPDFIKDANLKVINDGPDGKGAKLYISMLFTGCSMKNSLSYFVYTGNKEDLSELTDEEIAQLELINVYQLANTNTSNHSAFAGDKKMGQTPGAYTQLLYKNEKGEYVEEFPKGAIVGWRLGPSAFEESTFTESIRGWAPGLLSVSDWNVPKTVQSGNTSYLSHYTIYFATKDNEDNKFYCFGFEDQRNNSDEDFNDLIFHIYSDPIDALDPPPAIYEEDIEKDETFRGVLAFEDNWPKQGDYDLNDVVVKYTSTVTYIQRVSKSGEDGSIIESSEPTVKQVEDIFSIIHTGAMYNNAFSYKVDIAPSNIKRVTIDGEEYSIIPDGTGFIVDLCPNVKNVITPMEFGVTPKVYKVVMKFVDDAVLQDDFSTLAAPYNPFISPKETPGAEVHLPMYESTSRAERSLFNTEDDRSDQNNLWYVSGEKNQYPFAIHLSEANDDFVVPKESVKIYVSYPDYSKWVESNMTTHKDWYLNPAQ